VKTMRKTQFLCAFLVLLLYCGKNQDDVFQDQVQALKARISAAETLLGQNDPAATAQVKKWLFELKKAERLSLEAQEDESMVVLNRVRGELQEIEEGRDGDLTITQVYGRSSFSGNAVAGGEILRADSIITTGSNSRVTFQIYLDSEMTLNAGSRLKIEKLQKWERSIFCSLLSGSVVFRQKGKKTRFFMSAGQYKCDSTQPGEFEVHLIDSRSGFVRPNRGNTFVVHEGKRNKVQFGQGLVWSGSAFDIRSLLPAPELKKPLTEQVFFPKDEEKSLKITLSWDKVAGATRYYLDIFKDKKLQEPFLLDVGVNGNKWAGSFDHGVYYWRIRATDKDGLFSFDSRTQWFSVVTDEGTEAPSGKKKGPKLSGVKVQVMNDMAIITGRVSGRASVSVNHTKAVRSTDGSFEVVVNLNQGDRWITVIATSETGTQTVKKFEIRTN